jgi:hypothetical protein
MKTKILLLLIIIAGAVIISRAPSVSAQQFCVTIIGNFPHLQLS